MPKRSPLLLLILLGAACGGGSPPVATPSTPAEPAAPAADPAEPATPAEARPGPRPGAPPRKLAADETIRTPSGATFTASAGWLVVQEGARVTLTTPEGDLTYDHVELSAADRNAAIAAAWAQVRPGFALKVMQSEDPPPRDGWDAVAQDVYVTPAAEGRVVVAIARRKGATWYVVLLDGKGAAFDRRGAQLGTAFASLKVPGLDKESFAGKTANVLDAARLAELDAFVAEAMLLGDVPGVAIAIVQGGKVVHAKGYGVRELGKPAKVDADTLFMIGSTTKSLTTILMARLVDAGVFTWDTAVTKVLPSFVLGDEATTKQVTMRHTVCACTGMPRQDFEFLFEFGGVSPEARLDFMKNMKPTTGFGETFQYSNIMVAAGGYAAGHAHAPKLKLGPAYDGAMTKLVFAPLGMKTTTFDFKKVARGNHARPHFGDLDDKPVALPVAAEEWTIAVRPAGSAWSSVRDMARVLLLELGKGSLDGKTIVSEANLMARRVPQVKITDESAYGLGLFIDRGNDLVIYGHGGNTGGFTADFFFLPDHDVGVVVLCNKGGANGFRSAVQRRVIELLFDGRPEALADLKTGAEIGTRQRAEELKLVELEPDAAWFDAFIGIWVTPGLGKIELRRDKGKAVLDAGEWKTSIGRRTEREGTVQLMTTSPPVPGLTLTPREKDGRTVLVLDAGQHEYVFERQEKK